MNPASVSMRHHVLAQSSVALPFIAALVIAGCSGGREADASLTTEERYNRGLEELKEEDYLEAVRHFETLLLQDPASELADDAQFYLAEAYFRQDEYYTAAFQYSRVLTEFRGSPYYKRALYMTGECYFLLSPRVERDQKRTEQAIRQYQAFLQYFPNDSLATTVRERIGSLRSKLAERDYSVAMAYMDRSEFRAAAIYFQRVIDSYPETEYAGRARNGLDLANANIQSDDQEEN